MRIRVLVGLIFTTISCATSAASSADALEASRSKNTKQIVQIRLAPQETAMISRYGTVIRGLILDEVRHTPYISTIMLSLFSFGRKAVAYFAVDRNGKLLYVKISNDYNSIAVYDFANTIITRASANFPPPPAAIKADVFPFSLPLNFDAVK